METPGAMLREAREKRGLSLADVAAMTRIPGTMLEHLERDRFEEYVAEVFVRGHLRNYARELRLDPEDVLRAYERHTGQQTPEVRSEEKRLINVAGRPAKPAVARSAPREAPRATSSGAAARSTKARWVSSIRPTHMVAVVLVLFGLFVMVSFLTGSRATAQDPVSFPETNERVWQLEQNVEQTRWLLEQPAQVEPGVQAGDLFDE